MAPIDGAIGMKININTAQTTDVNISGRFEKTSSDPEQNVSPIRRKVKKRQSKGGKNCN